MAKKDTKVIRVRNTIVAFITLLAIGIFALGAYVSVDDGGEVNLNEDYLLIEDAKPRRKGDPIEVIEYFSYACVHCKNFDPIIEEWAEEQAEDVVFIRKPTTFSPIYAVLAQSYFALEATGALEENHNRIFRAIHDAGRQFLTADMVGDYVDGRGVSKDEFIRAFNSPDVRDAMRNVDREQRQFKVTGTPSLAVAGKYMVGMRGGMRRALRVVDEVIAMEREADAAP